MIKKIISKKTSLRFKSLPPPSLQSTDHQSAIITITPTSKLWVGDAEKLSIAFSQLHLIKQIYYKIGQECIPVGCVPADRWPYSGVCCSGGCLVLGGVWSWGGVWSRGVSGPRGVWSRGGLVPGGSGPGGLVQGGLVPGGVWSSGGVCWSETPPVNRMTNRCKNITLAKTSFRPVKITVAWRMVDRPATEVTVLQILGHG